MPVIFSKDALRASVEAATGGLCTVMYDDMGYPSYMRRISAVTIGALMRPYYADISAWNASPFKAMESELHPAFKSGGVSKSEIWIGQYQARIYDGRACSLPGQAPSVSLDISAAAAACAAKGPGWHLMTNWEWAALSLLALAEGRQPRGNTYYGRSHEATYETGTRIDGQAPGLTTGTGSILTGSGPASWRHDQTLAGVSDLVGNVAEWVGGLQCIDGAIRMPSDNVPASDPTAILTTTGFFFDSTVAGDGSSPAGDIGDPVVGNSVVTRAGPAGDSSLYGYTSMVWADMSKKAGLTLSPSLALAMVTPVTLFDGAYSSYLPKGVVYVRNYGNRYAFRGGYWSSEVGAGLAYLLLSHPASHSHTYIGFRPAKF